MRIHKTWPVFPIRLAAAVNMFVFAVLAAFGQEFVQISDAGATAIAAHPDGSMVYAIRQSPYHDIRRVVLGGTETLVTRPFGFTRGDAIAVAADGRVFLGGFRQYSDGSRKPAVWISDDAGATWHEGLTDLNRAVSGIAVDPAGVVYVSTVRVLSTTRVANVGRLVTWIGTPISSVPGGIQWAVVDDYSAEGQYGYFSYGITLRPQVEPSTPAEIWVSAAQQDSKTVRLQPVVRRSIDGGATWETVSTWAVPSGFDFTSGSWALASAVDVNGVAHVVASYGKKIGKSVQPYWLSYRSADGGQNWTLVDSLAASGGPSAIAPDTLGGVFVAGGGRTRASFDHGLSWDTIPQVGGQSVTADAMGGAFVAGGQDQGAIFWFPPASPASP